MTSILKFSRKENFELSYLGYAIQKLSKLFKYETFYDFLQSFFRCKQVKTSFYVSDSFLLSIKTEDLIGELRRLRAVINMFEFWEHQKYMCLFYSKNKKVIEKSERNNKKLN